MIKPSTGLVLKTTAGEGLREILRLPVWWYTRGLVMSLSKLVHTVGVSVRYFGVDVWAKNLFVPMYGDTSFVGRGISLLVRVVVLAVRSLGVALWFIVAIFLAIVYIAVLPVSLIGFVTHLIGVLF